jgi:prepilin-type processing-associated H-X9-DG protein
VLSARSYHGFGSNVAFADGHVSMIPNSIDLVVWRALGSRSGDEILASVLDE